MITDVRIKFFFINKKPLPMKSEILQHLQRTNFFLRSWKNINCTDFYCGQNIRYFTHFGDFLNLLSLSIESFINTNFSLVIVTSQVKNEFIACKEDNVEYS